MKQGKSELEEKRATLKRKVQAVVAATPPQTPDECWSWWMNLATAESMRTVAMDEPGFGVHARKTFDRKRMVGEWNKRAFFCSTSDHFVRVVQRCWTNQKTKKTASAAVSSAKNQEHHQERAVYRRAWQTLTKWLTGAAKRGLKIPLSLERVDDYEEKWVPSYWSGGGGDSLVTYPCFDPKKIKTLASVSVVPKTPALSIWLAFSSNLLLLYPQHFSTNRFTYQIKIGDLYEFAMPETRRTVKHHAAQCAPDKQSGVWVPRDLHWSSHIKDEEDCLVANVECELLAAFYRDHLHFARTIPEVAHSVLEFLDISDGDFDQYLPRPPPGP